MSPQIPKPSELAGAVDLAKVREDTERVQAEREARQMRAAERRANDWYRAMNRAFKGIYPKNRRRADHLRMIMKDQGDE